MSDYITLDALKGMTGDELFLRWDVGDFPFDHAVCFSCVTQHRHDYCSKHPEFKSTVEMAFGKAELYETPSKFTPLLHENLEQIYALRLYFRDLYPSNPPELDAIPREAVREEGVVK